MAVKNVMDLHLRLNHVTPNHVQLMEGGPITLPGQPVLRNVVVDHKPELVLVPTQSQPMVVNHALVQLKKLENATRSLAQLMEDGPISLPGQPAPRNVVVAHRHALVLVPTQNQPMVENPVLVQLKKLESAMKNHVQLMEDGVITLPGRPALRSVVVGFRAVPVPVVTLLPPMVEKSVLVMPKRQKLVTPTNVNQSLAVLTILCSTSWMHCQKEAWK